jgi:hypothetical protein
MKIHVQIYTSCSFVVEHIIIQTQDKINILNELFKHLFLCKVLFYGY